MGRQPRAGALAAAALLGACLLLAAPSQAEKLALHAPGETAAGSSGAAAANRRLLQIFG